MLLLLLLSLVVVVVVVVDDDFLTYYVIDLVPSTCSLDSNEEDRGGVERNGPKLMKIGE